MLDIILTIFEIFGELAYEYRHDKLKGWDSPIPKLPEELKTPPALWAGYCEHENHYILHDSMHSNYVTYWCEDCKTTLSSV